MGRTGRPGPRRRTRRARRLAAALDVAGRPCVVAPPMAEEDGAERRDPHRRLEWGAPPHPGCDWPEVRSTAPPRPPISCCGPRRGGRRRLQRLHGGLATTRRPYPAGPPGQAAATSARTGADVHVVFDGDSATEAERRPSVSAPLAVRVHYSAADVEADDVVIAMARDLPTDRPVVVVSSDRRVAEGRRHGPTSSARRRCSPGGMTVRSGALRSA